MVASKDSVILQALELNETDRLDVIQRLSESLGAGGEVARGWEMEIDRRLDDVASGRARFIPWEEARRQIAGDVDVPKS